MTDEIETEEHEPERDFSDRVEEYLIEQYGEDNVEGPKHLGESDRVVDFFVEGPLCDFAVEVENDFEDTIEGTGQGHIYAHDKMGVTPLTILPPDHVEFPEAKALNEHVTIVQLDV